MYALRDLLNRMGLQRQPPHRQTAAVPLGGRPSKGGFIVYNSAYGLGQLLMSPGEASPLSLDIGYQQTSTIAFSSLK